MANIDIIKAKITLLATRIDAAQTEDVKNTINLSVNDDFLRQVEAELKRAESKANDALVIAQLNYLQQVSEKRRQAILLAKAQREQEINTDSFDEAQSAKINADIQFLAETTDQATLDRILQSIATTRDLKLLQNAVKKMAQVRGDIKLQPSEASFVKKGLSASDWRNKLNQIDVAIQKRMIELREAKQKALSGPLDVPAGGGDSDDPNDAGPHCTIFGCYQGSFAKFFAKIGIWILLAFAILMIVIVLIYLAMKLKKNTSPLTRKSLVEPENKLFPSNEIFANEDEQLRRLPVQQV